MRSFKHLISLSVLVIALSVGGVAQAAHQAGSWELRADMAPFGASTGGAGQSVTRGFVIGEGFTSFALLGGAGYFIMTNLEVGGQGGFSYYKPDNVDGIVTVPLLAIGRYHIDITGNMAAVVGGGAGIVINDPGDTGIDLNIQGGIEYFLTKAWAIHATAFLDIYHLSDTNLGFGVTYGLSTYF